MCLKHPIPKKGNKPLEYTPEQFEKDWAKYEEDLINDVSPETKVNDKYEYMVLYCVHG